MNSVNIIGRIGNDPEIRQVGEYQKLGLRVCVNRRVKRGGQWEEKAVWFSTSAWGKDAENLARILRKGDQVGVSGELDVEEYETKAGEKRVDVRVENARITLPPKGSGGEQRGGFGGGGKSSGNDFPADDFGDDEIPF